MTTMNVDKLLVAAGAYFGGDGINYDRFEPHKFANLVLANTPPQPEQEPVAWMDLNDPNRGTAFKWKNIGYHNTPLYTTPPQRTWVGLTDEEFQLIYDMGRTPAGMMEMVEAKLKEKNA